MGEGGGAGLDQNWEGGGGSDLKRGEGNGAGPEVGWGGGARWIQKWGMGAGVNPKQGWEGGGLDWTQMQEGGGRGSDLNRVVEAGKGIRPELGGGGQA